MSESGSARACELELVSVCGSGFARRCEAGSASGSMLEFASAVRVGVPMGVRVGLGVALLRRRVGRRHSVSRGRNCCPRRRG